MLKSLIRIKDQDGKVFTMPSDKPDRILEVYYHTTYYQFIVQESRVNEYGELRLDERDIFVPIGKMNWKDFMPIAKEDIGSIIEGLG